MRWRRRSNDAAAAAAARRSAEEDLERIRARRPEVKRVAGELRAHQRRNEFAAMIARALGGSS